MSTPKFGEEGRKEGLNFLELDFDFYENPDTIEDRDFCGKELDRPLYYVLHDTKPLRCVAFEGSDTGRSFYGCAVKRDMNCGVVEWVDHPWPIIMQRCLLKLWGMLHESNDDRQAKNEEISRLKMDIEQVNLKLENLVAAVERTNVTTMNIDRQKKQMGIVVKHIKRIQRSLTSAIQNLKDERGEIKMNMDFLKEEVHKLKENRKKMQSVICDLLGQGFADTDDLLMIKAILEE
nr:uncharacterized protein LOC109740313 [Aegilops tauschii subsp. strangulata]